MLSIPRQFLIHGKIPSEHQLLRTFKWSRHPGYSPAVMRSGSLSAVAAWLKCTWAATYDWDVLSRLKSCVRNSHATHHSRLASAAKPSLLLPLIIHQSLLFTTREKKFSPPQRGRVLTCPSS